MVTRAKNACVEQRFENSHFTVCTFDPARHDIALMLDAQNGRKLRSFSELATQMGKDRSRVAFAMNAGMYDINSAPIGLYIENGIGRHPVNTRNAEGNFYKKPNGIFWIDKTGSHISTTYGFIAAAPADVIWATQSGPMLVIDGALHPEFVADGPSRKTRNGVGITTSGETLFVISDDPISFGKFARFFRDQLDCPNALYFDGTVSGIWNGATGHVTQPYPLGPFIVVMDKSVRRE